MNRTKKDYPVTLKINGDFVTVHLSFNDIMEATYGMSDEVYVKLVQETVDNFPHFVHKEIAKVLDLEVR